MKTIKAGADFILPNGDVISNAELTFPSKKSVSYAFCSDTAPLDSLVEDIHGVDCLYHEATFLHELINRAQETFHSTAIQAAQVAIDVGAAAVGTGCCEACGQSRAAGLRGSNSFLR